MLVRCLILAAVLLPASVQAQGLGVAISDFDEGNRRYRMGDYQSAVDSYERALHHGFTSEALYFNMGNAYFRLDQIGQAIRYYEKARRLEPEVPELQHNLSIARERTIDTFSQLPEPFWMPVWGAMVRSVGSVGLFAIGMLFYLVAAGALGLRIRSGQTPWRRRMLTAGLVLAVCFFTFGFASSAEQVRDQKAVVLVDETTLLEAPDGEPSSLNVHEGLVVDVVSTAGEWREVRLPNGTRGWMTSDALGEI